MQPGDHAVSESITSTTQSDANSPNRNQGSSNIPDPFSSVPPGIWFQQTLYSLVCWFSFRDAEMVTNSSIVSGLLVAGTLYWVWRCFAVCCNERCHAKSIKKTNIKRFTVDAIVWPLMKELCPLLSWMEKRQRSSESKSEKKGNTPSESNNQEGAGKKSLLLWWSLFFLCVAVLLFVLLPFLSLFCGLSLCKDLRQMKEAYVNMLQKWSKAHPLAAGFTESDEFSCPIKVAGVGVEWFEHRLNDLQQTLSKHSLTFLTTLVSGSQFKFQIQSERSWFSQPGQG